MQPITDASSYFREITLKVLVQHEQFDDWLRRFFFINESLHKEYDSIYQQAYYIYLHGLITEGVAHLEEIVDAIHSADDTSKTDILHHKWNEILLNTLCEIRDSFSAEELIFIEYKRHNSTHIFQEGYEPVQRNGRIKTKFKNANLVQLWNQIGDVLGQYGGDQGFDEYIISKLYPLLSKLHNNLQDIRTQQVNQYYGDF